MGRATPSPKSTASAAQVKHDNAVALLLCWANKSNDQTGYTNLVLQLYSTFEDIPHDVRLHNASRSLEIQVVSKISVFALSHDGPDNLLIIYYTGLVDIGEYCFKELNNLNSRNEIVWIQCEKEATGEPALLKALQVVGNEAIDGEVYTTADIFDRIRTELSGGLGRGQKVELHSLKNGISLEEYIVLQFLQLLEATE
ncbi:MAG: hypothetical protein Q9221_001854 [Calogaya cf. arnoldii]